MSVGTSELLVEPDAGVDVVELAGKEVAARSPRQLFWRRFRSDKVAMVSAGFIILLILIAIFAALVVKILGVPGPYVNGRKASGGFGRPLGTSAGQPFGVAQLGRGVLARGIYGSRVSLEVGIFGTGIAAVVGTVVGLLAGYYRGCVATIISRVVEV